MNKKIFVLLFAMSLIAAKPLDAPKDPFFLVGDGRIQIKNHGNGRAADVTYLNADGTLNEAAFRTIDAVFGFPTDVMGENISRRTIGFLDFFSDRYATGKVISLTSGYRSQDYNNALRRRGATAAKTSTHIDGMAIDFSLPGVDGKTLWDNIREFNCCGVGYYYGNVLHLDSGRPRFWTTETSKVHTGESDFNRSIYVSTEYDRYAAASLVRVLFTSVSDFGFGVQTKATLVKDDASAEPVAEVRIQPGTSQGPSSTAVPTDCLKITDRKQARFLWLELPAKIKSGRYRVQLDFCAKPFMQMPDNRQTNAIEIR